MTEQLNWTERKTDKKLAMLSYMINIFNFENFHFCVCTSYISEIFHTE